MKSTPQDDDRILLLLDEANRQRRTTFGLVALSTVSLVTAVLLVPVLFTYAQVLQRDVHWPTFYMFIFSMPNRLHTEDSGPAFSALLISAVRLRRFVHGMLH